MLFNPFRLIGLLLLITSSLLAQSVGNPQALKNTPDIHVSVQPARISVGHNLPEWTFEFVPDEFGLILVDDSVATGNGVIKISNDQQGLVQTIKDVYIGINKTMFAGGNLFQFININGWNHLIFTNSSRLGAFPIQDFYSFDSVNKKFSKIKKMSNLGYIEPKGNRCVLITHLNDRSNYEEDTFCFKPKFRKWEKTKHIEVVPTP